MADPTLDLLLTVEEVQAVTTEPLSPSEAASIATQATAAVRDHCGWRVAKPADEEFTLSSRGGRLLVLPSLQVNDILSLTEDGEPLTAGTDFEWDSNGIIERLGHRPWSRGRRSIVATINHGYAVCPGGIAQAIAAAVARGVLAPAGGIASETAIGQSIVYSRMSAGGLAAGAMFVSEEMSRLDAHRIPVSR